MRWVGAIFLALGAYILGKSLAKEEGEPVCACDSLIRLLSYIRRRMSAERTPLQELFSEFEDGYLESVGFLHVMRSHRSSLPNLWSEAVSLLPTDSEINRELLHFGSELGTLPLEEQEKRIDSCLEAVTSARNKLYEALPAKQKSIKTVCLMTGLLTAIILL